MLHPATSDNLKAALFHCHHQLMPHFIACARIGPPLLQEDCFAPGELATAGRNRIVVRLALRQSLPDFLDDVLDDEAHFGSVVLFEGVDPAWIEVAVGHKENVDWFTTCAPFTSHVIAMTIGTTLLSFGLTQIVILWRETVDPWKVRLLLLFVLMAPVFRTSSYWWIAMLVISRHVC